MGFERDVYPIYKTSLCHLGHCRYHLLQHYLFLLCPILATESLQRLPLYTHRLFYPRHARRKLNDPQRRKSNLITWSNLQIYMHKPATLPYIFASTGLYTFDHVARLIKSRLAIAHVRPLPELDLTRVVIPTINAGWRAGQHVRLRVISFKMGWFGWAEVHPFTIASVAESGPEGMVLMCKRAGGWTRKLYEIAKLGGYEGGSVDGREVRVVVEGPYGSCFFFYFTFRPH